MSVIPQQIVCDLPNCSAIHREANNWYVALADDTEVRIIHWDKASQKSIRAGKHFCGVGHALEYASCVLTPDKTDPNRESSLKLRPPLARDGAQTKPEAKIQ